MKDKTNYVKLTVKLSNTIEAKLDGLHFIGH